MSTIRRGFRLFLYDMRNSLPVSATFAIALLAFVLVMAIITGFRL